ncbi:MAG: hypothetical protein KC656_19375 [Myxococcales bacterium]|nr:hypothetical protein [Myxococcales bacterium]
MVGRDVFAELVSRFPPLGGLAPRHADIARDELRPTEVVQRVDGVGVWGRPGVVAVSDQRVLVVGSMKMLWVFSFPAIATLDRQQLHTVEARGELDLFLAGGPEHDDDGEAVQLSFSDPGAREAFAASLHL